MRACVYVRVHVRVYVVYVCVMVTCGVGRVAVISTLTPNLSFICFSTKHSVYVGTLVVEVGFIEMRAYNSMFLLM